METSTKVNLTEVALFHLNNRQSKHEINIIFDGKEIDNNHTPS